MSDPTPPIQPDPPAQPTPPTWSTPPVYPTPPAHPSGEVFVVSDDAELDTPDSDSEAMPRPSARRTATVISGRIVLGLVAVGAIALVAGAAAFLPLPSVAARPLSTVVVPVPVAQQIVCPGGLLRLASTSGDNASSVSALGRPTPTSGAVPSRVEARPFARSDAGTGGTGAAPLLLTTQPGLVGSAAPLLGGAQSESVATDEFSGLSSAGCVAATGDSWLAGGATSVGRTTLLLLSNPTAVAATVAVQVFGESGQVQAPGMSGIAVAAGSQRVLSLAGFAPGVVSPVVHVQSTGGQVVADLEQSTVRGLVPGGIDFVGPESGPQTTTVIPGVSLVGTAAMQNDLGQSGFDDLQTVLRVYLPGTGTAKASIDILAEDGSVQRKPITADLDAGTVVDLPLDNLSDGDYTIVVKSSRPVVAGVRVSTVGSAASGAGADFAWASAAPLLTSRALVAVASGVTPLLHLENPTGTAQSVSLSPRSGADITATVPPESAVSVPVLPGQTYQLTGFVELYAAVSGTTDGGVTSYAISPSTPGDGPLRVYR
ncbi:MAG: DUF5719 family protein [Galbitalea sp.]